MKHTFLLFFAAFALQFAAAQNPTQISIKGMVADTSGEELPFSTVMLLNPKDSSLLLFKQANDKGEFEFTNVKNIAYVLKVFSTSYIPYFKPLSPSALPQNDVGTLKLKVISKALMEVVVKTAKATLTMKGDTIEYNAAAFKVPPGSTVEDLLRRLPGMEVDGDGNIKAQGKDIKNVYVDGKTFFSNDPKAATRNLDAHVISKVQVFTEKSEQEKLTGVSDGKKDKAMNLELKEEFKKGAFGKITAAGGSKERWASRGNYNRFNKTEQFSVIGYGNNINETGVNWEDYSEFKGQNAYNGRETGDFGFNAGGGNRFIFMNDANSFVNNFDGRGFTKNAGIGTNYNFDNKKRKFNANYLFNQVQLNLDQFSEKQSFLKDGSFYNTDTLTKSNFRKVHSIASRIEQEIDSMNTLIVKVDFRGSFSESDELQHQLFTKDKVLRNNDLSVSNANDLSAYNVGGTGIFRHKFKRKGRAFALSGSYNWNKNEGIDNLVSINQFFTANNPTEQIRYLNRNNNNTETQQIKSSLLYVEPLSKKFFLETFYNFVNKNNDVSRQVTDPSMGEKRLDSLSIYYENDVLYNRLGSTIRYAHEGVNVSAGLAAQQISLGGKYAIAKTEDWLVKPFSVNYLNVVPYLETEIELPNDMNVSFNYSYQVEEPQLTDLQPIPNVNNPAFRIEGNPNLSPERNHDISSSLHYWNSGAASNIGINAGYKSYDNRIVYKQTIENIDKIGLRTTTSPVNVAGGNAFEASIWGGFPIIKNKLKFNCYGNLNFDVQPSFVNDIENETRSRNYNLNSTLTLTPNPRLIFSVSGRLGRNEIKYSISPAQNQVILNNTLNSSLKLNVYKKLFLESNLAYTSYVNERFGFDQKIPIWNASLRQLLTKNNKMEMRLAVFDILDRRVKISQFASQNYVSRSIAPTLARYVMLSISYNVRGYESKLAKNNWW